MPLFFGGNLYLFKRFPLRPYAGLGFGLDIMKLGYTRQDESKLNDVSARIGFELHAGLELRISNYLSFNAELMQLWSARRKISNAPDLSNESFSVITGLSAGFPIWKHERELAKGHHRKRPVGRGASEPVGSRGTGADKTNEPVPTATAPGKPEEGGAQGTSAPSAKAQGTDTQSEPDGVTGTAAEASEVDRAAPAPADAPASAPVAVPDA